MGQQSSREHAPLTFGYVNRITENDIIEKYQDEQEELSQQFGKDFVLANPHLYQLQALCKQCNSTKNEVIVSTLIGESCNKCQKQKRLSLVRKDLAEDLNYIDQTYYPDLVHYNTTEEVTDPMEEELLELENDETIQQQWSRLTIGEATHTPGGTRRRPRRLTGPTMSVDLSNRSLIKLSPSIGYLDSLTNLNLSNNQMTSVPREIGYLKNLRVLNISNNAVDEIPDTIAFLSKLKALNVSQNKLVQLPASIGSLPKLVIIIANNNNLKSLPREFIHLVNLISLNVSNNPLKSLPAEIATLKSLRKLLTDECPFEEEYQYNLRHDPPSLFETCARTVVKTQTNIPNQLADHIKDYLAHADTCTHCNGPFFDSYVTRVRFIERRARQAMALEYTLCSAHWSNDNDRLLAMFSQQSNTGSTKQQISIDGLNDDVSATTRNRAYSDTTHHHLTPPATISSRRSHSNASEYPPSTDYFPIVSILKPQPNLPALPQEKQQSEDSSLLQTTTTTTKRITRPRASSTASVTKRFTNFIRSNSSTSITRRERSFSGSSTSSLPAAVSASSSTSPAPKRTGLRDWTDSIQTATAAATSTIASQQQQEQIESIRNHRIIISES